MDEDMEYDSWCDIDEPAMDNFIEQQFEDRMFEEAYSYRQSNNTLKLILERTT